MPRKSATAVLEAEPGARNVMEEPTARSRFDLADYVIAKREEAGLAQHELAERAGLTRSFMNAIERGKIGLPSVEKRRAIAEALRVRHVDLLVAAGEIDASELGAGTPRDFVKYPELQSAIETLSPDAVEALEDFMYFLMAKPPRGGFSRAAGRAAWLEAMRSQRNALLHGTSEDS